MTTAAPPRRRTLADRVARLLDAPVVHVDDVSWHEHPVHWADLLVAGVLRPWLAGTDVTHRPRAWEQRGRAGAITAPAGDLLVVEGVGAGRHELDLAPGPVVWVQSDHEIARSRGIERDVAQGRSRAEAMRFWQDWERAENPFLAAQRPWDKAAFAVLGTPPADAPGLTWVSSTR